jgi:hypothetical protein
MVVSPYKGETTLRLSKGKGNNKTCMSTIRDGAKARIVTDRGYNATKVKIGKTSFSNRDGKDDISKGRHRISIM